MYDTAYDPKIEALLNRYRVLGGVIDHLFLPELPRSSHREAALIGMKELDRRMTPGALYSEEYSRGRLRREEEKLVGKQVTLSKFWGTNGTSVNLKPILGQSGDIVFAGSMGSNDGYCGAFFHPPHGLSGAPDEQRDLFRQLSHYILGRNSPDRAEIYSWSTDWSAYFDAGNDWWGSFYWTVRPIDLPHMVVIAASTTD